MGKEKKETTFAFAALVQSIGESYNLGIHCLVPIILVFSLLIMKMPAIPAIIIGGASGLLAACLFQGESVTNVVNAMLQIAAYYGQFCGAKRPRCEAERPGFLLI